MASARNNRRRKRSRGRFGPLFKLLCALTVVVALTMGATVFFQVEQVVVTGNSRYTQEEVIQATGIQPGDNLFHMNKFQIARQVLQQLPYTKELLIRRGLPSTIIITMTEWDAVACVKAPAEGTVIAPTTEGDASGDQEEPVGLTDQDWLISVGGKLLEPAPPDTQAIAVTGLSLVMPRAGTVMEVRTEERTGYEALLSLLASLEEQGMMGDVSAIRLSATQVGMDYLGRFRVEMPLNADFNYKLRALAAAVAETEKSLGDQTTGTFDLTQEGYTAVYSPD